ncbi:MAG: type II secretion system F family protein, partial [Wujia sp.]
VWFVQKFVKYNGMKKWRQLYVTSEKELVRIREEYYVTGIVYCICVIVTSAVFATVCSSFSKQGKKEDNLIVRQDYAGDTETYLLELRYGDELESYELNVNPLTYTYEEFIQKADELFDELSEEILGNNASLDNITDNLSLVTRDKTGTMSIIWRSQDPAIISSSGKLWENAQEGICVELEATVEYMDYSSRHIYNLVIGNRDSEDNPVMMLVKNKLSELEEENRTERELVIPEVVDGVTISRKYTKTNLFSKIMCMALLLCGVIVCSRQINKNNMWKYRNNMLILQYPLFVNRMCLLMGTGMTIRNCLKQYVMEDNKEDYLIRELKYILNCIENGMDEAAAYEQLGKNLELPMYSRLMNHISQNLRMGTKKVRELMEEELHQALETRKENARKKGEEASTKLLFPMIVLLLVVMLIIVLPTLINL